MSDIYRRAFERHYCVTEGTPLKEIEAGRRGDRYRSAHIDRAWESWQKEIGHLHPAPAQPQVPDEAISVIQDCIAMGFLVETVDSSQTHRALVKRAHKVIAAGQPQVPEDEIDRLKRQVQWYAARCNELQKHQHLMRDPERKMVCDILANGKTLEQTAQPQVPDVERDLSLSLEMLADWAAAVRDNGGGWDYWDDHYKNVMYGKHSLRDRLDVLLAASQEQEKGE